jgi:hypothetical protein
MNLVEIAKEIRETISNKQSQIGLSFEEENHIYTMNGKKDYPSVSKVLKHFYTPFPADEIANRKANGNLEQKQILIKQWEESGNYSTNLGSRTHFILEQKSLELFNIEKNVRQPQFECDLTQLMKSDNMIIAGNRFLELMSQRGAVLVDTEVVMGSEELGYCGQGDSLWVIENKNKDGIGLIWSDYKTNQAKSFQTTKYTKKMLHPFQNYDDTALGHYYVQLPLYGKLILKMLEGSKYENLKLYGCIIVHLRDDTQFEEFRAPKEIISTVLDMDMKKYLV